MLARFLRRNTEHLELCSPIRLALIGSGKAAKAHLHALEYIKGVEIACVVNRGNSNPNELMRAYSIPRWHRSVDDAMSAGNFDAAIVAVTCQSTFEVATRVLQAGVPCLIEKPLGCNSDQAGKLSELAPDGSPVAVVGYNRRFYDCVMSARELVDELGALRAIHIEAPEPIEKRLQEKRVSPEAAKSWLILNTSHAIDLFTLFGGEHDEVHPLGVTEDARQIKKDYIATIRFRGGIVGVLLSHWDTAGDWEVRLYGSAYKLVINLTRNSLDVITDQGIRRCRAKTRWDTRAKPGICLQDYHFLEAVARQNGIEAPLAGLRDGYETIKLAEKIGG